MKKPLSLATLVLALSLAFGACGAPAAQDPEQPEQPEVTNTADPSGEVEDNEEQPPVDDEEPPVDDEEPEGAEEVITGVAAGFGGDVTATVTLGADGKIVSVTVDAPSETQGIGSTAAPVVAQAIVDAQSVAVDSVSGATVTSEAVIAAVTSALTEAGVMDNFN